MTEQNPKKILVHWLPTLLTVSAILVVASLPIPRLPGKDSDKVAHFFAYAFLSMLAYRSLSYHAFSRPLLWAALIAIATGALDETIQSFNKYRTASGLDLLADALGALLGSFVYGRISSFRNGQKGPDAP